MLPFARTYGDWCIASGPAAQDAERALPRLPVELETRRWSGPDLAVTVRGTADFFARRVATSADDRTVVIVIGAPLGRATNQRFAPADFMGRDLDVRCSADLWGQFTIVKLDLRAGTADWLIDLERSVSPWWTSAHGTRVALRFAPRPSAASVSLEAAAAGEFLVHGIVGGSATPIAGWSLFDAAASERWSRGRSERRARYPHPIHAGPVFSGDPYEEFAESLAGIVTGIARSSRRLLLPLTGGIDSRLILAAALARRLQLETYTHGAPGCADELTARQYGAHASFVHRFHAITAEQHAEFRSRVETSLAFLGPDYDSFVYPHLLTSYAAEPGGASFLSGVGTGLHKIPYVPWLAMQGARMSIVDAIVGHYGREDQANVLRPAVAAAACERMRESIDAVARECEPGTARVHVMQYYHLQERLGRWAGRGVQLQDLCGYEPCYPFLHPDLMRASRRLGYVRLHFGQKIIRALEILAPELLRVDNANGWPCTRLSPLALLRRTPAYWRGASRYVSRRRTGYVAANIAIVDYRDIYRDTYRAWMHDLLAPESSHLVDIVRPEALRASLDELDAGRPAVKRLGALAALEMWARS